MLSKLKAAYVGLYLTFATVVSIVAITQLLDGMTKLGWLGVFLTAAPTSLTIGFMMAKPIIARTSQNLTELHIPILIGLILAMFSAYDAAYATLAMLSVASYIGFLLYVFWYSRYQRDASTHLTVGKNLPRLNFSDLNKKEISTDDIIDRPSVFIFYRGNWCPLCMAQIKEIAKQYQQIETMGAQVLLVSPQPHKFSRGLAKKHQVNFRYLTDVDNKSAKKLGIVADFGIPTGIEAMGYETEAPMPTVIVTDKNGKILWADETDNYRVRPEPETFINVLKTQAV